jgi:predicted Zn-dependent peptidase
MSAKNANKENDNLENNENENFSEKNKNLGEELDKINNLLKDGVLTQEEFEKAKKKILDN